MSANPNKLSQFWQELKRRRVIHVIIVYATSAFVIIELVNNVYETLNLPEWTPTLVILLLVVGFPIALIFSWIYDITLKGITKTEPVEQTRKKKKGNSPVDRESRFENSIAVLPFQDMSPKKDQEYFCDGIAEEIINALARVESLKVIARTSAFAFKNKQIGIREIGHKLNIKTILEGSIRKDGNRLRITAQLINVSDGFHMWSEIFDREIEDVFAVQDEISLAIVDHLKIKLLGEEKMAIAKHATKNLDAFNLYLKGNYSWQMMTPEGLNNANKYFKQALQKDPKYAMVYVGLAAVQVSSTYFGNVPPNNAFPKANIYLKKSLEIDNTLAEAHCYLGVCNLDYYWSREKAELNFKEAIQLNPNSALIRIQYSLLLSSAGRHQEAISEAKRAQELDPLSSHINTYVGQTFYFDSQFDRAIKEFKLVISLNPNYFLAHSYLGVAFVGKTKPIKAFEEFKKAYELSNGVPQIVALLAVAYFNANKKKRSEKLFEELKKRSTSEYIPPTCFFMIHKVRGEEDLAFEWLERACEERDGFLFWFRVSPVDSVFPAPSDDTRYKALMKKYGLEK